MNDDVDKLLERVTRRIKARLGIPDTGSTGTSFLPEAVATAACLDTMRRHFSPEHLPVSRPFSSWPGDDAIYLQEGTPERRSTEVLIISDIHLGSPVSRARDLSRVLQSWDFRRLIVLGDLFDNFRFQRLSREHWHLLSEFRDLRSTRPDVEVVWVNGNHDGPVSRHIARMIHAELVCEETPFTFEVGGRNYAALHGHQFDPHVSQYPIQTHLGAALFLMVQRADFMRDKRVSRWIKRQSKELLKVSEEVAAGAVSFARRLNVDAIVCGHTHLAVRRIEAGLEYINSGCWTESPATLVSIDAAGARLVEYY